MTTSRVLSLRMALTPNMARDVDDANAAHLHVVARQFGAGAEHFAAIHQRGLDHVVGHQAVAALDQGQHRLALANAAFAADDGAHAEDVHHAAQFGGAGGEHHFERQGGQVDEFHGHQRRLKNAARPVCSAAAMNCRSGLRLRLKTRQGIL